MRGKRRFVLAAEYVGYVGGKATYYLCISINNKPFLGNGSTVG
jgi:hypothetical protein